MGLFRVYVRMNEFERITEKTALALIEEHHVHTIKDISKPNMSIVRISLGHAYVIEVHEPKNHHNVLAAAIDSVLANV